MNAPGKNGITPTARLYDLDTERAVLGAVLVDPEGTKTVAKILKTVDFYLDQHRLVFSACLGLHREGERPDLLSVTDRLRKTGKLEACGGPAAVSALVDATPDLDHVETHARIVLDYSRRREAVEKARRAITFSAEGKPLEGVRIALESGIEALTESKASGKPDLSILDGNRHEAPPLPISLFGHWKDWIEAASEATNAAPDYVAAGLLSTMAGTIGNAAEVSPWQGWKEPSILWVGTVGVPGSGKSPALDPLRHALAPIEQHYREQYEAERDKWESEALQAKIRREKWEKDCRTAATSGDPAPPMPDEAREPEKPSFRRVRFGDATVEATGMALKAEPRGLLLERDELAGWLGSFGRYSGAVSGERGFWIEAFGARPYTVDRVKAGNTYIPRLTVSILGTSQPEKLNTILLTGDDDGLPSRFLWVWPEPRQRRRPGRVLDIEKLTTALRWLRNMPMAQAEDGTAKPQLFTLDPGAQTLFETWWKPQQNDVIGAAGLMSSTLAKGPGFVLRLSLVLALADAAYSGERLPYTIGKATVARAVALWEEFFVPMAARVFGDAALPQETRDVMVLANWLKRNQPEIVNARNLRRQSRGPGISDSSRLDAALDELVAAGWLTPAPSRIGDRAGRPKKDYKVRPELLDVLREVG